MKQRLLVLVCLATPALPASAQHMAAPEMYRTESCPCSVPKYTPPAPVVTECACCDRRSGWSNNTGTSFPFAHVSRFLGLCEPIYICDRQFYTRSPIFGSKSRHCSTCPTFAPASQMMSPEEMPYSHEPPYLKQPLVKPIEKLPPSQTTAFIQKQQVPEVDSTLPSIPRPPALKPIAQVPPSQTTAFIQRQQVPEADPTLPSVPRPPALKPIAQAPPSQAAATVPVKNTTEVDSTPAPAPKVALLKPATKFPAPAPWSKGLPEVRSVFAKIPAPSIKPIAKLPAPSSASTDSPEGEQTLLATLRTSSDEETRRKAALALGKSGTRSFDTLKTLNLVVSGSANDGNPAETSPKVKEAALTAIQQCLSRPHTATVSTVAKAPPPIARTFPEPPAQRPAPEPTRAIHLPPESLAPRTWSTAQRQSVTPTQTEPPTIEPVAVPIRENPFRAVD